MSDSDHESYENDGENFEEDEMNPAAHKRLLQAIGKLGKNQHIRQPTRSEPAFAKDEFNLAKSLSTKAQTVSMGDVVSVLKKTSKHIEAGKELSKSQQTKKILKKPLEKPVAERIQRTVGYEKAKKSLSRWDAVVETNRAAEHQIFPLEYEEYHVKLEPSKKPRGSSLKTELMLEMEAVEAKLRSLKSANPPSEDEDEIKLQQKLTRDELIARRKELAYLRMKESQKSARARLKNKIKSKKYHKIQKREKLKEQIKEFEELQKTNPEAALEKLDSIERNRILERASLRHKNTGTWAKNLQVRAKFDKDVRKDLAEQLALSRELTEKQQPNEESESDTEDDDETKGNDTAKTDPFNPWCKTNKKLDQTDEVSEYFSGYRKYWTERNKNVEALKQYRSDGNEDMNGIESGNEVASSSKEDDATHKQNSMKEESEQSNQSENSEEENEENGIKNVQNNIYSGDESPAKTDESANPTDSEEEKQIEKFKSLLKNMYNSKFKDSNENSRSSTNNTQKSKLRSIGKSSETKPTTRKPRRRKVSIGSSGKWIVEDINEVTSEDLNIDDIFDEAEDIVKKKVKRKISDLTDYLNSEKYEKAEKRKTKHKPNSTDLSFKIQPTRPEIDEELIESPRMNDSSTKIDDAQRLTISNIDNNASIRNHIDPNDVVKVIPKRLRTALPDMVNSEEPFDEDEIQNEIQMTIAEAFADDDIVADFEREREEERKKSTNEEVDLTLPGWGSWAGCGISKEKKAKRLILKFPKDAPRKDDNKDNVYINEDGNKKVKEHLVSELPFPFTSVQEYEASIRAPVGRNFVPETAFRMLTRPATVTKLGAVIEPMNDDILVKPPKRPKTVVDKRIDKMNKNKAKL